MPTARNVFITKDKYKKIIELLEQCVKNNEDNIVETFDRKLKEFLDYDPSLSCYDPLNGKKLIERRKQRCLDEGKTLYELYRKPYIKKKTDGVGVQNNLNNNLITTT